MPLFNLYEFGAEINLHDFFQRRDIAVYNLGLFVKYHHVSTMLLN